MRGFGNHCRLRGASGQAGRTACRVVRRSARRSCADDGIAGPAYQVAACRPQGGDVNDYDPLRDYLKKQTVPELVLSFEQIEEILDAALPRAAHRASWWETLRSPQEKMPQREACLEAGYIATRQADGKSVKFKKVPVRR